LPEHILLIIDEAYAEFTDTASYPALFDLVEQNNTVILRTFSKIYGLAGMRVGWGYFPSDIYKLLRKVLNPNNISAVSQACAVSAMQQQRETQRRKNQVKSVKADFCRDLQSLGYAVADSHSNFVLINFKTGQIASDVYLTLKNQGIILRPMNAYGLPHCLRATISRQQHMDMAIEVLKQFSREPV
jgi:histidinol-phosphate/aromatic aminotransferase/cobyric acid decarboxylase-like protein